MLDIEAKGKLVKFVRNLGIIKLNNSYYVKVFLSNTSCN